MTSNWDKKRLGELISVKGGLSYKGEFLGQGEGLLLGMGCVSFSERFLTSGARLYSGPCAETHLVIPGDLVLATRQQSDNMPILGFPAMIPESYRDKKVIVATNLYKVTNNSSLSNRFLYWLLKGPEYQRHIVSCSKGTTVRMITKDAVESFEFNCPSENERNQITDVLDALDKKIEINKALNNTLEQMAQAIFKSWFVDFDPVKAKMNGEQPEGMDEATASLFPEKLVESELGLIPEGWELTNIGKVSECFDKKRIPLSKRQREQKQGSIPYYGATSVMDYVDEAIFDDIYLLIGEDGSVMKDDGTPFIQYIWGPAWVNNHAHVLQGIKSISTEQLMLFFQQTNINAYVTGAVQLKINQRNMNSIPFIKAPKEINERFYDVVAPLYAKIRAIKEENEQLAKLRDTLLPKLLSGEIELETNER